MIMIHFYFYNTSKTLAKVNLPNHHIEVKGIPISKQLIGSVCVDVKGEISHATLNKIIKIGKLQLFHIVCINMILQNKVQRLVTNNFSIGEGPRISITITVQGKVHKSLTNNFSNSKAPRISH